MGSSGSTVLLRGKKQRASGAIGRSSARGLQVYEHMYIRTNSSKQTALVCPAGAQQWRPPSCTCHLVVTLPNTIPTTVQSQNQTLENKPGTASLASAYRALATKPHPSRTLQGASGLTPGPQGSLPPPGGDLCVAALHPSGTAWRGLRSGRACSGDAGHGQVLPCPAPQ